MNKPLTLRSTTIFIMVIAAALCRLLPHPPNFTPLGALALFAGTYVADKRLAFGIPLASLVLSDAIIGFHPLMLVVYGCFAVMVLMGFGLRNGVWVTPLAARVPACSVLFFVVTNFSVWAIGSMYPRTPEGLLACYVAAVPFFQNTVMGDIVYSTLLFGSFALAERMIPSLREKTAVA